MGDDSGYWQRFRAALAAFQEISNEHAVISRQIRRELVETQEHAPRQGAKLLDIGPGFGLLSRDLPLRFATRLAVEPNPYLVSAVEPLYDQVFDQKWENVSPVAPSFSVILASQVLYYFPDTLRVPSVDAMMDSLQPDGILFLTLDTFDGSFGEFVRRWSETLGISNHVVLPEFVRHVLSKRTDIEVNECELVSVLQARSLARFAEGVSVYFDAHPDALNFASHDYQSAVKRFCVAGSFFAENKEILWSIRKRG